MSTIPKSSRPGSESPLEIRSRDRNWWQASLIPLAFAVWMTVAVAGSACLWVYATRPGVAGSPPPQWPQTSALILSPTQLTLVMFVHPKCPCTRASIGELAILMAHAGGRLRSYLMFERPAASLPNRWEHTDLWTSAAQIPGVAVSLDYSGEAQRFGSATSGQTAIYDRDGRLRFSGGITAARGHWGDNAGVFEVEQLLRGDRSRQASTPVFGCRLFGARDKRSVRGALTCKR